MYRIPATDIDTSKTGLYKAAELVKEYKQLVKYNFNKFLLLASATNRLDKYDMGNYINTFLEIKRHKQASCTYKNYVRKSRKHIKPKFELSTSPLMRQCWFCKFFGQAIKKTAFNNHASKSDLQN